MTVRGGVLLCCLGLAVLCRAQAPDTLWMRGLGGDRADFGYSIEGTPDGGFIIAGITSSYGAGDGDVWLVKLDGEGGVEWTRTYGGENREEGRYAVPAPDGGYIIVGMTESYGSGGADLWLLKTDISGALIWSRTEGGAGDELGNFVQVTSDGGIIAAGRTTSGSGKDYDVFLLKTDLAGNKQWTAVLGGDGDDLGYTVCETEDGDYLVAGYTNSFGAGGADLYLICTDYLGNLLWHRTYGGFGQDYGGYLLPTSDGGYLVCGETHSFGSGSGDLWLLKVDSAGEEQWQCLAGGAYLDGGYQVIPGIEGGYLAVGWTVSLAPPGGDAFLVKVSADGNQEWARGFGGIGADRALGIAVGRDDQQFVTGYTRDPDDGDYDLMIAHLADLDVAGTAGPGEPAPESITLFTPYPNPGNDRCMVRLDLAEPGWLSLKLVDLCGRPVRDVADGWYDSGVYGFMLDAQGLTSGVYFLALRQGTKRRAVRWILLR